MATEKILNTRIQLKCDTLANWESSELLLKKGEVAIAIVDTAEGSTLQPVMFKVGTSENGAKFRDLDWASAKAADVYGWAKKAGIEIEDSNTGKFVTGISWNASTKKLAVTRANAVQSVALTGGTNNGTLKLTVDGTDADNIAVTGLGSAAFTNSDAYATKNQGANADAAATALDGITGKVKDYVDGAIQDVVAGNVAYAAEAGKVSNKLTITLGSGDTVFDGSEAQSINIDNALTSLRDDIGQNELTAIGERIGQTEGLINDVSGEVDGLKNNKLNVSEFNAFKADNAKAIDDAEQAAKDYADGLISTANLDQYTTEQEVKDIVDGVIAGAADDDTYNSLTKLVDYIDAHGGEAANMAEAIETLEGKVDTIEKKPAYGITATQISNWDGEVGAKALAESKTTTAEVKSQIEAYGYATTGYADDKASTAEGNAKTYVDNQLKNYQAKGDYKTVQTAVSDPTADGKSLTFIDTISQNANGVISATKKNVNLDEYALKAELPTVNDGVLTVAGEDGLDGSGTFTANQGTDSTIALGIANKGVTTAKIADNAIGAAQTKAVQGYNGTDAEVWVFDCGNASTPA